MCKIKPYTLVTTLAVLTITVVPGVYPQPPGTYTERQHWACHGSYVDGKIYMDASCDGTDKIAVKQIMAGAKRISTDCEPVPSGNVTVDETLCCSPSGDDNECVTPYDNSEWNVKYSYNRYCSGRTDCPQIQVANMQTPSSCGFNYLSTTNFMYMDYYCIVNPVNQCPSASLARVTSTAIHLSNEGYPSAILAATAGNCRCSVETNQGETISITAIDIRLETDTETNTCQQSINVTDEEKTFVIDCSHNNSFAMSTIYNSSSNFLQLSVTNNLADGDNRGYFWIAFAGANPSSNLTLNCVPVDGVWSNWGEWGTCSTATCGTSTQTRSRSCDNPRPANGGADCVGEKTDSQACDNGCVNGDWSAWGVWGPCSNTTCGTRTQKRSRSCDNPSPINEGADCLGEAEGSQSCDNGCVNGEWSPWMAWSNCSVACGPETHTRNRSCDNPPPANGGEVCPGPPVDNQPCDNLCGDGESQLPPWLLAVAIVIPILVLISVVAVVIFCCYRKNKKKELNSIYTDLFGIHVADNTVANTEREFSIDEWEDHTRI